MLEGLQQRQGVALSHREDKDTGSRSSGKYSLREPSQSLPHSFLWLNTIPLYVHTTFCLSIHLLMDTWVAFTFWLLWIMLLWKQVSKYLFGSCLQLFWSGSARSRGIVCSAFRGTSKLFSTAIFWPSNSNSTFRNLPWRHTSNKTKIYRHKVTCCNTVCNWQYEKQL